MQHYIKIFILTFFVTVLASCSEDYLDINSDPNRAVESNMTAAVILPQAMLNTANRVGTGFGFLNNWLGYWAPGANYSPNGEEQSYNITTNFGAGLFTGINDNTYDYAFAELRARAAGENFYVAVAKTMKAHNFVQLVDIYDKVPYTEAMKGLEFVRPKYDEGKLIYDESMKQLDSASILMKKAIAANEIGADNRFRDIIFKGDGTKWLKFINTLKLRTLLHQSAKADRGAYITAEIAKITTEGSGFLGTGEDAAAKPAYTQDKANAYYASYGFNTAGNQATDFWRGNKIALGYLKADGDPRIGYFYKKTTNAFPANGAEPFRTDAPAEYRGNEYGRPIDNSTYPYQIANFVSQVGGVAAAGPVSASSIGLVKGFDQAAWILTSVESMFLQAEAIQRGWLPGDKEAAYKAAVKESFRWLNVDLSRAAADASFDKWYQTQDENGNKNVSYAKADDKLKVVLYQKYLAMNGSSPLEAWTDYRRNGAYPAIPLSVNPGRTSPVLPVRLLYPQIEYNLNTASVTAVGTISQFNSKVWWMN